MLRCGAMEWRTKNWTFCIIFYEKNQCFLFAFPSLRDFDAISILEALRILQYSNWLNFVLNQSFQDLLDHWNFFFFFNTFKHLMEQVFQRDII